MTDPDTTWLHWLRRLIKDKEWAKWGSSDKAVYPVIRGLADFHSGTSDPTYTQIMEFSGLASKQVRDGLKELEERGFVRRQKHGRAVTYCAIEKLPVKTSSNEIVQAVMGYIPKAFQEAMKEIQAYAKGGATCNLIRIEKIVVNVALPGSQQINAEMSDVDMEALRLIQEEGLSMSEALQELSKKR